MAYNTLQVCMVHGTAVVRLHASCQLSMDYSTLQVCMVYGTAAVRLHSSCQRLTAPCLGVWPTAQLRCAFTRGVTAYSTLHVCMVYCTPVNVVYDLQLSCGTTLR